MASIDAFLFLCPIGLIHLSVTRMRFKIPGQDLNVRLFERVVCKDGQYDIFDVGIEQADGTIDSVAIGGSFAYAKSVIKTMDANAAKAKADAPLVDVAPPAAAA